MIIPPAQSLADFSREVARELSELEPRSPAIPPLMSAEDFERELAQPPTAVQIKFKSIAKFCAEYVPLAYVIEQVVRSGLIYTLTARTGAGKTALNVVMALAVGTGRPDVLKREVTKGRVAYLARENPDDIRMRFKIAAYLLNIDLDELQ